jgi:hypothetical protein
MNCSSSLGADKVADCPPGTYHDGNSATGKCSYPGVGKCAATAVSGATVCSTVTGSKSAIDCPEGTYSNEVGAVKKGCLNPGVGKCAATAASGATVCSTVAGSKSAISCPEGTYSNEVGAVTGCRSVTAGFCASTNGVAGNCINGRAGVGGVNNRGATHAAACPAGKYSDAASIENKVCTWVLSPTGTSYGECQDFEFMGIGVGLESCKSYCVSESALANKSCGAIFGALDSGDGSCFWCSTDFTRTTAQHSIYKRYEYVCESPPVNGINCVNPGVGKCVAETSESSTCFTGTGSQKALDCPAGTYSNEAGAVINGCLNPGVGKCAATAASGETVCSTVAGSKSSIDCPVGTYSNEVRAVKKGCAGIPAGSCASTDGVAGNCINGSNGVGGVANQGAQFTALCAAGKYSDTTSISSNNGIDCVNPGVGNCAAATIGATTCSTSTGSVKAMHCPASTYSDEAGAVVNGCIKRGFEVDSSLTISSTVDYANAVLGVDLDKDGDIDVISASYYDNKVVWYENKGSGSGSGSHSHSFTEHLVTNIALGVSAIFAIDLDLDGDIDLLSASYIDNSIRWYSNNGQQEFTPHTVSSAALGASTVVAADLNNDGSIDIIAGSIVDDKILWFSNDGQQIFTAHVIATNAKGIRAVVTSDVDGDGNIDIIAATFDNDSITWYSNNGAESFTSHLITASADGSHSIFAVDLNQDGKMDIVSASTYDGISWYKQNDNVNVNENVNVNPNVNANVNHVTFTNYTITSNFMYTTSVYVADIDGDGDLDVISASSRDNMVAWYENRGLAETFTQHKITTNAAGAFAVYAIDMDLDGDIDVLSASRYDSKISMYENKQPNTPVPENCPPGVYRVNFNSPTCSSPNAGFCVSSDGRTCQGNGNGADRVIPCPSGRYHPGGASSRFCTAVGVGKCAVDSTSLLLSTNTLKSAVLSAYGTRTDLVAGTGTYSVAINGGSGTGAVADVTLTDTDITGVTVTTAGTGYVNGDNVNFAAYSIGGFGAKIDFSLVDTSHLNSGCIGNNKTGALSEINIIAGFCASSDGVSCIGSVNTGAAGAIPCPAGRFSDVISASDCTAVTAGFCASLDGLTGSCINGSAGIGGVTNTGAKYIASCAAGKYSDATSIAVGGDTSGGVDCMNPGMGKCVVTTSTNTTCSAGIGSQKALDCPIGTYSSETGAVINGCLNPVAGKCASTDGITCSDMTGSTGLANCPTGTYHDGNSATSRGTCSYPDAGKCASIDGSNCQESGTGATTQVECTNGKTTLGNIPSSSCTYTIKDSTNVLTLWYEQFNALSISIGTTLLLFIILLLLFCMRRKCKTFNVHSVSPNDTNSDTDTDTDVDVHDKINITLTPQQPTQTIQSQNKNQNQNINYQNKQDVDVDFDEDIENNIIDRDIDRYRDNDKDNESGIDEVRMSELTSNAYANANANV